MKFESESLKAIFDQSEKRNLVLPNFQRDFVWKREDQAKLLASFLSGLPIGSILLIEGENNHFAARGLCYVDSIVPQEQCRYLLDGQQRLSCLRSIFSDLFEGGDWRENWDKLFSPLRNRWFIKIQPQIEEEEDIWGWKTLRFSGEKLFDPYQLENFIECKRIFVQDVSQVHHPAYKPTNSRDRQAESEEVKRVRTARALAQENLVPLYELYSDKGENALHSLTLKNIAIYRRDEIRAEVEAGSLQIGEILGHLEPDILDIWFNREEESNQNKLNDLWAELFATWQKDVRSALEDTLERKIVSETILPYNEIGRATAIFETINKGGTPLSTFDLMVARVAVANPDRSLSEKVKDFLEYILNIPNSFGAGEVNWSSQYLQTMSGNSIAKVVQDQFLNVLSVLCYSRSLSQGIYGIKVEHIKQTKMLALSAEEVIENLENSAQALIRAYAFLQFRCGILSVNDLNYRLMVVPIAYILSDDKLWSSSPAINKLEYWYWSSLFSGSYREKQNERTIGDIQELFKWITENSDNPFSSRHARVLDDSNYSDKAVLLLETLPEYEPPAAIKSGILEYVLSKHPRDFDFETDNLDKRLKAWEVAANDVKLEDHHLIPLGSAKTIGQTASELRKDRNCILNSPLNRTYISQEANRKIRDMSPEKYLDKLQDLTLYGHSIPANVRNIFPDSTKMSSSTYTDFLSRRYEGTSIN